MKFHEFYRTGPPAYVALKYQHSIYNFVPSAARSGQVGILSHRHAQLPIVSMGQSCPFLWPSLPVWLGGSDILPNDEKRGFLYKKSKNNRHRARAYHQAGCQHG